MSRSRSLGFPKGCRATNRTHRSISLSTRGIRCRYGGFFTQYSFENRVYPLPQSGVRLLAGRVVLGIEGIPTCQLVILRRRNDFIPVDAFRRIVVPARLGIHRIKVVGVVFWALHRRQGNTSVLFNCTHKFALLPFTPTYRAKFRQSSTYARVSKIIAVGFSSKPNSRQCSSQRAISVRERVVSARREQPCNLTVWSHWRTCQGLHCSTEVPGIVANKKAAAAPGCPLLGRSKIRPGGDPCRSRASLGVGA